MFSTPERRMENETITFYVPVKKPIRLGLKLQATSATTLLPDVSAVKVFETLRTQALNELTKTEQLFKNKPTLASLDSITPKWGVIYNETEAKGPRPLGRPAKGSVLPAWSPYTQFEFPSTLDTPCLVDLVLTAILITRSTISPKFGVVFLSHESPLGTNGSPKSTKNVIDFDWSPVGDQRAPVGNQRELTKDLEEVEDISEVDAGTLTLKDPAVSEKEKNDAKEYVRDLFRIADEARSTAIQAMGEFFRRYSVSDDESQFSEWVEEDVDASSDGIESLPELPASQKKYEQGY